MKRSLRILASAVMALLMLLNTTAPMPVTAADETPGGERYIYKHVVILGVDGGGKFFQNASTPNLDRIFADGSVTYSARCMTPSISGQNWGSILHGVLPEFHACTNSSSGPYPSDSPYPSIFRIVRENDAECELASFNNWYVINNTEIEAGLDIYMDTGDDDTETGKIVDYLSSHQPKLMFVQFDSVDGAGHSYGNTSTQYLSQISHVDGLIGEIYDKMVETGMMEDTLLIVTADHGHTVTGGHGGTSDDEMTVMIACAGKSVISGEMGDAENRDVAAITLYALGLEDKQPDTYSAKIPGNLFPGVEATERVEYVLPPVVRYAHEGYQTPAEGSGVTLFDYINKNDVLMYMPLDGDVTDKIGTYTSSQLDKLYFVDGYFGQGARVEDGAIVTDYRPGTNSFSISCWVKFTAYADDPSLFSNKDWDSGRNPGFIISYRGYDMKFNLGNGSSRMDVNGIGLPDDFLNGWMPVIFVVDRSNSTVGISIDFSPLVTYPLDFSGDAFNGIGGIIFGQDGTGKYPVKLPAVMDELIIFGRALTAEDIGDLRDYYRAERFVEAEQSQDALVPGDITNDGAIDIQDVILLLQHQLFPDLYPVDYAGSADFNSNNSDDMGDVIALLQYSIFPDLYPINDRYIYKHVVILGVDGGGNGFREASTPNLDRIFENGSLTYYARCMTPSISGQNWGSILHGVLPEFHGCTNSSSQPYPSDDPFPSIFRVVREADPDCELASFNNWSVINRSEIESGLNVYMDTGSDDAETDKIVEYLDSHQPKLMFVQFDSVDGAGHSYGNKSQQYFNQISHIDGLIGRIYDKMVETGMMEDTLIIVTADHGHKPTGGHGGLTTDEMNIMLAVAGKSVIHGVMDDAENRDVAAITLYALGLERPQSYTAKIPGNIFPGVDATERVEIEDPESGIRVRYAHEGEETPADGSGRTLFDFIDRDSIALYIPLDGNVSDVTGNHSPEQKEKLYFIDGYYGNGADVEDGAVYTDYNPGSGSFSVSCWLRITERTSDPCVFSNKNWDSGYNPGFVLSYISNNFRFNLGDGTNRMDADFGLPYDFLYGWVPVIFIVDRDAGTVSLSLDFKTPVTYQISDMLINASFDGIGTVTFGQDGTCSYKCSMPAVMDELVIYNRALTAEDIANLKSYYQGDRAEN